MKRLYLLLILIPVITSVRANHITGGQIYYTFAGQSGSNYTYNVTLNLYRDCYSTGAQLDPNASIAIFDRGTGAMVWQNLVPRTRIDVQNLSSPSPCINNPPPVCYQIGYYQFSVTLPASVNGYIISYQRCCRIAGINNIAGTSSTVGATYTAEIPGTAQVANGPANNSAHFIGPDTVIVCQNTQFTYSFNAFDADGDSLVYSFCDAYTGGSVGNAAPNPPSPPPYTPITYAVPFSGSQPMGAGVTINPQTGLVTGPAPAFGIYVVTACVYEFRNGQLIATQRKDLQIKVGDCSVAQVNLSPSYITCNGYSWTFVNGGDQSLISSYFWTFGDPASGINDSSTLASPTHVFSDTGVFIVTLITNRYGQCSDTGHTIMRVYPGFFPGFTYAGICANHPTQFHDTTRTIYGVVNSWSWNFGVTTTAGDTSHLQNPTYTYTTPGVYNVQFIVTNSKGCIDTVIKPVTIMDKPPLTLAFRDTLICIGDSVKLLASGNGTFSWTPLSFITSPNTPTPTVHPPNTTYYYVQLNDSGCLNNDSVHVRVVATVSLTAFRDTTICQGDSVQLHAISDASQFLWTPSANFIDPTVPNPIAITNTTTTYHVTAYIGHCSSSASVIVKTIPYPQADAGPDTTICFNSTAQLHAKIVGSRFSWSPTRTLSNPAILNPIAVPSGTTSYILTVTDTLGCPKPKKDTIVVTVLPKINAFAGRDTMVVVGQPLQFFASGGLVYFWSPGIGLNSTTINNPVGIYDSTLNLTKIRYKVLVSNEAGCIDSAFITVRIFKTNPQVFVPTAFTPNGDGLNDVFRPIAVGIKQFEYFRVYNRWGQLVFSTTINGQGWDGNIGGKPQGTNTFVWIVKGIDYLDRPFFKKGTVTLIR
jgi:gliding motility-associated-like protein